MCSIQRIMCAMLSGHPHTSFDYVGCVLQGGSGTPWPMMPHHFLRRGPYMQMMLEQKAMDCYHLSEISVIFIHIPAL